MLSDKNANESLVCSRDILYLSHKDHLLSMLVISSCKKTDNTAVAESQNMKDLKISSGFNWETVSGSFTRIANPWGNSLEQSGLFS